MVANPDTNQGANKTYDESTCDASGGVGTDHCWHELRTGTDSSLFWNTIITSATNAYDASFRFHVGAYLPSPINDSAETTAGTFTSTINVTLWSNP